MARLGSERATRRWLGERSALGELLEVDFATMGPMRLYRASDALMAHREAIEHPLFDRAMGLFDLRPTVTLYDLTNTFFEGEADGQPKARRGHSKDKRTDCPLLTLGLVLDASGFVRRSQVFAGNVREHHTLAEMLDALNAPRAALVVMDRGIATEDRIQSLREHRYRYLVVKVARLCAHEGLDHVAFLARLVELELTHHLAGARAVDASHRVPPHDPFGRGHDAVACALSHLVQSTGRHAEGTAVGFSKKKKGARSYYPLFSTLVQTGEVFDVHDSNGARDFVVQCVDEIRSKLPKARIETRVDSAFFSEAIVDALDGAQVEFTELVPFERFPALKRMIEGRRRWRRIDEELSFLESQWKPDNWTERYRFLFIRTRVRRQNNEPIQLDLFVLDPTINLSVRRRRSSRRRTVGYSLGVRSRRRCIRRGCRARGSRQSRCRPGYACGRGSRAPAGTVQSAPRGRTRKRRCTDLPQTVARRIAAWARGG